MHYRRACDLDSGSAVAHACLADTMLAGDPGRPERLEALHHLRTAVRLDPGFIVARVNLAAALTMLGFHTEAVTEYTRVLELSPGNPAAILGVVRTYEAAGQIAEAEAALRPWLDMASSTPEIALAYGIMGSHMKARTPAIEAMKAVIIQGRCDPEIEKAACFRIGDLLDKEGEYSSAFSYYERGNALHPVVYDPKGQTQRISILTDFFSAERIAKLPRATNRSRLPVFIVGMPRSGTTLVETILASHPLVHGAGELDDLFLMRPEIARASRSGKQYPECLETIPVEALNRFGAKHLESLAARDRDATRVTDKLPQNFLLLGLIDLLFPGARVIHCMRDPLDTCLSIYCQPFQQHHTYADNLTNIGHYYREYIRLMAHWRTVLRIPLLDLHYEDLVINPEENTRLLLDFCELKWDERCLRHHESGRVTNTFSYNQVRQPIYRKSVARWRGYEKHLGPLIEALGDACDPTSGAT
jgi:tetratricopeptide (TPR) repeat protein